jgi:hypothetical protein
MSDQDEKREQDEAEVEGHLRSRGAELNEDDGNDTPDVEGHFKRNAPVQKRPTSKRS